MCTAVPSSAAYWSPKLINSPTGAETLESWEPESDIRRVTYRLRRTVDEDGVEHIDGLDAEALRTLLVQTEEEGRTVESTLLSDQVKFFYVRYWDGAAWTESWSGSGPAVGGADRPGGRAAAGRHAAGGIPLRNGLADHRPADGRGVGGPRRRAGLGRAGAEDDEEGMEEDDAAAGGSARGR